MRYQLMRLTVDIEFRSNEHFTEKEAAGELARRLQNMITNAINEGLFKYEEDPAFVDSEGNRMNLFDVRSIKREVEVIKN